MKRLKIAALIASCVSFVFASAARAEDDTAGIPALEQVDAQLVKYLEAERTSTRVITASKKEQTIEEAPAIITVISKKDIVQRGYRMVGEALRSIPGLAIIDDHVNWNVGVRGLYAGSGGATSIIKVMINGQQTSLRSTLGNAFGPELIPLQAIERIEVMRGPGSALYGANAFLGVINIITIRGQDVAADGSEERLVVDGYYRESVQNLLNGGAAAASAGSYGAWQYLATANFQYADRSGLFIPGLPDLVAESLYDNDPKNYPPPQRHPSPGINPSTRKTLIDTPVSQSDLERVGSAYASVGWEHNDGKLFVDGNFQYSDKGGEWLDYTYLTHATRLTYTNGYGRAKYVFSPRNAPYSLTVSGTVSSGGPTASDQYVDPSVAGVIKRRHFGYLALDGVIEGFAQLGDNHSLIVGADYTQDREELLRIATTNASTGDVTLTQDNGNKDFDNTGVYALWQWHVLEPVHISLGARADRNSVIACDAAVTTCLGTRPNVTVTPNFGGSVPFQITNRGDWQLTSHASLVWSVNEWLYSKLVYGSSYRPPSPFDLYQPGLTINDSNLANPYLKPQTATTVDVLLGLRPTRGFSGSVSGFFSSVTDLVVTLRQGNGTLQDRNADVTVVGMEGQVAWTPNTVWSLYANASYFLYSALSPQQNPDETTLVWQSSVANTTVPVGSYPALLANAGLNAAFPEHHVNVNVALNYVGERNASLTDTALYSPLNLSNTYTFDPYLMASATVSSLDLHWFNDLDTRITAQLADVAGGYFESGYGGVDIPSLGGRFLMRLEQSF